MSYVVLARKYRPQSFDDVVGQNPVSQTLLNALTQNRVAHAYVFSGPRGVGKTTTARILAKCLNCVKGPTKTPCNTCDSCVSISNGTSLDDVLEIDGASNRGIEQIRELRESAKYAPSRSRYRIYIIDEAHQITKDAFGALLKTLEEPPPHVVFMMATTEANKIPAPILSRCQRFTLRPIASDQVLEHLKNICKKEKVKVDDEALAHIVRFTEGSLRDALSLLDQAVVFSPEGITPQTVRDLLGLLPKDLIRNFSALLLAGEPAPILKQIAATVQEGTDLTQLGKDLQNHYHTLLLAKAGVEDPFKLDSEENKKESAQFDYATLERNIRLLSQALDDMRHSETPRAVFEVFALKLAQKTLDPRVLLERLEKLQAQDPGKYPGSTPPLRGSPHQSPSPAPAIRPTSSISSRPAPAVSSGEATRRVEPSPGAQSAPAEPEDAGSVATMAIASGAGLENWAGVVEEVSKTRISLGAAMDDAKPALNEGRLTLTFSKSFNQDLIKRSMETLRPLLTQLINGVVTIDTRVEASAPAPAAAHQTQSLAGTASAPTRRHEPLIDDNDIFENVEPTEVNGEIQKALKHFPGTIKRERKN